MPIFDSTSTDLGGSYTYDNVSPAHIADINLPADMQGLVTVIASGWCSDTSPPVRVYRKWRDLKVSATGGVVSLESRAADVDASDSSLASAVVTLTTATSGTGLSLDAVGSGSYSIYWEGNIEVTGQSL